MSITYTSIYFISKSARFISKQVRSIGNGRVLVGFQDIEDAGTVPMSYTYRIGHMNRPPVMFDPANACVADDSPTSTFVKLLRTVFGLQASAN